MIVGVDGGGSKTTAVVLDRDLNLLGRGEGGSSNLFGVGLSQALANITAAVDLALQRAGVTHAGIQSWGIGLAGACSEVEQAMWRQALQPLTRGQRLAVDEDAPAAQKAAFAGAPGAVCIAGTGANCFGVDAAGRRARADGQGPVIGDRGGGYWIGRCALRAYGSAADGSGPPTKMLQAVAEQLQANDLDALVRHVYAPGFGVGETAALAPLVERCAGEGDAVAQAIIRSAGLELAATTMAVLEVLDLRQVAVTGGILRSGGPVRASYIEALAGWLPGVSVVEPQLEPAAGAALLAV